MDFVVVVFFVDFCFCLFLFRFLVCFVCLFLVCLFFVSFCFVVLFFFWGGKLKLKLVVKHHKFINLMSL